MDTAGKCAELASTEAKIEELNSLFESAKTLRARLGNITLDDSIRFLQVSLFDTLLYKETIQQMMKKGEHHVSI